MEEKTLYKKKKSKAESIELGEERAKRENVLNKSLLEQKPKHPVSTE